MSWAAPSYNDSAWSPVRVGLSSGPAIFDKYDGFAWYRFSTVIPSSLKRSPHIDDSIKFFLGKIDDCDQVYLNGHILGQNTITLAGTTAPDENFIRTNGLWQTDRAYTISVKDDRICWDTVNIITVRVFDQQGGGGLYGKSPYIGIVGLGDYIRFDLSKYYKVMNNDSIDRRFLVRNISPRAVYAGELSVTAERADGQSVVFNWKTPIRLAPGDSVYVMVSLPVSTEPLNIGVTFTDDRTSLVAKDSVELLYALSP